MTATELAHFEKTVELPSVRERIAARAASEPGRALARELAPLGTLVEILEAQARTKDGVAFAGTLDLSLVVDAGSILERAKASGRPLDPRELWLLARTARAAEAARKAPLGPALAALTVEVDPSFAGRVEAVLDPETAEVKDELVRDVRDAKAGALAALEEALVRFAEENGASVARKDGRPCIATRSPLAGTLVGREGPVSYFEPDSVRDLANRTLELELEESSRVDRFLLELDALARAHGSMLRDLAARLARIDLHLALGRFARELDMCAPELAEEGPLHLEAVRHPLLAERGGCVPIDVVLDGTRLLVITGPNGGGKTVALKSTGIACFLALSGSFVPARRARVPVFEALLAAAGAPDDLAHGLSTFEVHARRLAAVATAGPRSLVLLDELGLGTDPIEGAALGRALLEHLLARGALVLATTHLGPLKTFAATTTGAAIASMEVDAKGRPVYRLALGKAGESSALEVARRSGVPASIVARAEEILRGGRPA